jgi:hypothetical protein
MNLADKFARTAHANQKYGDGQATTPMRILRAVVAVLADFGFDDAKWNATLKLADRIANVEAAAGCARRSSMAPSVVLKIVAAGRGIVSIVA